ncbi:hypothetical protein [Fulvivirga ligni]|uniref:hypothetical protein n=1 Tax=Fulvivirga ligni TaxID=2904246 RepID=UPI001F2F0EF7|nr:hypothetical protein [Fulvivirga ligni]UII21738.1 hypothetical protein LVD16_00615 [Fulvivirga ligni]
MSGGAGHLMDMINRMKANNGKLSRNGYFGLNDRLLKVDSNATYKFKKASKGELKIIRKKLKDQSKKELLRMFMVIGISILVAAVILGAITTILTKYYI